MCAVSASSVISETSTAFCFAESSVAFRILKATIAIIIDVVTISAVDILKRIFFLIVIYKPVK